MLQQVKQKQIMKSIKKERGRITSFGKKSETIISNFLLKDIDESIQSVELINETITLKENISPKKLVLPKSNTKSKFKFELKNELKNIKLKHLIFLEKHRNYLIKLGVKGPKPGELKNLHLESEFDNEN